MAESLFGSGGIFGAGGVFGTGQSSLFQPGTLNEYPQIGSYLGTSDNVINNVNNSVKNVINDVTNQIQVQRRSIDASLLTSQVTLSQFTPVMQAEMGKIPIETISPDMYARAIANGSKIGIDNVSNIVSSGLTDISKAQQQLLASLKPVATSELMTTINKVIQNDNAMLGNMGENSINKIVDLSKVGITNIIDLTSQTTPALKLLEATPISMAPTVAQIAVQRPSVQIPTGKQAEWQKMEWTGIESFAVPTTPIKVPELGLTPGGTGKFKMEVHAGEATPGIKSGDYFFNTVKEATNAQQAIHDYYLANTPIAKNDNYIGTATTEITGPGIENSYYEFLGGAYEKHTGTQTIDVNAWAKANNLTTVQIEALGLKDTPFVLQTDLQSKITAFNAQVTQAQQTAQAVQATQKVSGQPTLLEALAGLKSGNVLVKGNQVIVQPVLQNTGTDWLSRALDWAAGPLQSAESKAISYGLTQKIAVIQEAAPPVTAATYEENTKPLYQLWNPFTVIKGIEIQHNTGMSWDDSLNLARSDESILTPAGKTKINDIITNLNINGAIPGIPEANMESGDTTHFFLDHLTSADVAKLNTVQANNALALISTNPAFVSSALQKLGTDKVNSLFDTDTAGNYINITLKDTDFYNQGFGATLQMAKDFLRPEITGVPIVDAVFTIATGGVFGETGWLANKVADTIGTEGISAATTGLKALREVTAFAKDAKIAVPESMTLDITKIAGVPTSEPLKILFANPIKSIAPAEIKIASETLNPEVANMVVKNLLTESGGDTIKASQLIEDSIGIHVPPNIDPIYITAENWNNVLSQAALGEPDVAKFASNMKVSEAAIHPAILEAEQLISKKPGIGPSIGEAINLNVLKPIPDAQLETLKSAVQNSIVSLTEQKLPVELQIKTISDMATAPTEKLMNIADTTGIKFDTLQGLQGDAAQYLDKARINSAVAALQKVPEEMKIPNIVKLASANDVKLEGIAAYTGTDLDALKALRKAADDYLVTMPNEELLGYTTVEEYLPKGSDKVYFRDFNEYWDKMSTKSVGDKTIQTWLTDKMTTIDTLLTEAHNSEWYQKLSTADQVMLEDNMNRAVLGPINKTDWDTIKEIQDRTHIFGPKTSEQMTWKDVMNSRMFITDNDALDRILSNVPKDWVDKLEYEANAILTGYIPKELRPAIEAIGPEKEAVQAVTALPEAEILAKAEVIKVPPPTPATIVQATSLIKAGKMEDAAQILKGLTKTQDISGFVKGMPDLFKDVPMKSLNALRDLDVVPEAVDKLMAERSKYALTDLGKLGDAGKSAAYKIGMGEDLAKPELDLLTKKENLQTAIDAMWTPGAQRNLGEDVATDIDKRFSQGLISETQRDKEYSTLNDLLDQIAEVAC